MHFFQSLTFQPSYPRPGLNTILWGKRVVLRPAVAEDFAAWSSLRAASREFLQPWEPSWPANALTRDYFMNNLRRQTNSWRAGKGYTFLIFKRDLGLGMQDLAEEKSATDLFPKSQNPNPETLLGGITLNDITRGIAQKGTLGYWMGVGFANQGYMSEAVQLVCNFAFTSLQLNRVEASCLPRNAPSKRLLKKSGFVLEGQAANYLRINGQWEDHLLWGRVRNN